MVALSAGGGQVCHWSANVRKLLTLLMLATLSACASHPAHLHKVPHHMDKYATSLITVPSDYSVDETIARLSALIEEKGLRVFASVDHYENAKALNLTMRPSKLLIFGSPKIGSPLMDASPTIGIDLPVKALAYKDKDGQVYLSYNNPDYLKARHNITDEEAILALDKMRKALAGLSKQAVTKK